MGRCARTMECFGVVGLFVVASLLSLPLTRIFHLWRDRTHLQKIHNCSFVVSGELIVWRSLISGSGVHSQYTQKKKTFPPNRWLERTTVLARRLNFTLKFFKLLQCVETAEGTGAKKEVNTLWMGKERSPNDALSASCPTT